MFFFFPWVKNWIFLFSAVEKLKINENFFLYLSFSFHPFFLLYYRKNLGASTISSALNAHAGNMNGNSVSFSQHFHICQVLVFSPVQFSMKSTFFDSEKLFSSLWMSLIAVYSLNVVIFAYFPSKKCREIFHFSLLFFQLFN